jgi:hypothetical protein
MNKYEIISATKRYGKRTPGLSILLCNGKEFMVDKTSEVRDLYNSLLRDRAIKSIGNVYVVVTIVNDGERDLFSDVVLITTDKKHAQDVTELLVQHKPVRGLKKSLLSPFDSAAVFTRPLNSLKCWR